MNTKKELYKEMYEKFKKLSHYSTSEVKEMLSEKELFSINRFISQYSKGKVFNVSDETLYPLVEVMGTSTPKTNIYMMVFKELEKDIAEMEV